MGERVNTIATKTPLRISFVGGGTDLPWFYQEHGGCVINTAIDKCVMVKIAPRNRGMIDLRINNIALLYGHTIEIKHEIIKESIRRVCPCIDAATGMSIEISSDVAAGTGLGSSSALTVGLLHALHEFRNQIYRESSEIMPHVLVREACEVEIDILGKPIGKQNQYASTYGGFRRYVFDRDGDVEVSECLGAHFPFKGQVERLEARLLLFDTHIQRPAETVLESQRERNDIASLLKIKGLEEAFYNCLLIGGDIDDVGVILHEGWLLKRQLSEQITNLALDEIYRRALDAGAVGGKLLGAGGGGHFLFYVEPEKQDTVKKALEGLATHVPFRFESKGTRLV